MINQIITDRLLRIVANNDALPRSRRLHRGRCKQAYVNWGVAMKKENSRMPNQP